MQGSLHSPFAQTLPSSPPKCLGGLTPSFTTIWLHHHTLASLASAGWASVCAAHAPLPPNTMDAWGGIAAPLGSPPSGGLTAGTPNHPQLPAHHPLTQPSGLPSPPPLWKNLGSMPALLLDHRSLWPTCATHLLWFLGMESPPHLTSWEEVSPSSSSEFCPQLEMGLSPLLLPQAGSGPLHSGPPTP